MICLIVAAACWLPPIPLQPLPPPPPLVRSELQEHGWRLPALEVVAPAPPPPAPSPPARGPVPAPPLPAGGVEQWRTLVTQWFGARVDAALSVIDCESGGNPSAVNGRSGAAGLFQHLPRYWPERSSAAGFAGADILDAEANVAVAAWLSDGGTNWTHWECSPS